MLRNLKFQNDQHQNLLIKTKNAYTDINDFTNSEKDSDYQKNMKLNGKNNTEREYLRKIDFDHNKYKDSENKTYDDENVTFYKDTF